MTVSSTAAKPQLRDLVVAVHSVAMATEPILGSGLTGARLTDAVATSLRALVQVDGREVESLQELSAIPRRLSALTAWSRQQTVAGLASAIQQGIAGGRVSLRAADVPAAVVADLDPEVARDHHVPAHVRVDDAGLVDSDDVQQRLLGLAAGAVKAGEKLVTERLLKGDAGALDRYRHLGGQDPQVDSLSDAADAHVLPAHNALFFALAFGVDPQERRALYAPGGAAEPDSQSVAKYVRLSEATVTAAGRRRWSDLETSTITEGGGDLRSATQIWHHSWYHIAGRDTLDVLQLLVRADAQARHDRLHARLSEGAQSGQRHDQPLLFRGDRTHVGTLASLCELELFGKPSGSMGPSQPGRFSAELCATYWAARRAVPATGQLGAPTSRVDALKVTFPAPAPTSPPVAAARHERGSAVLNLSRL